ncbi:hypothetical protein ACFVW2_17075 [Streptomyces sp. NPDC058171]
MTEQARAASPGVDTRAAPAPTQHRAELGRVQEVEQRRRDAVHELDVGLWLNAAIGRRIRTCAHGATSARSSFSHSSSSELQ